MAQLDSLLVQGIRAIGPDAEDAHVIKFQNPLTIIAGPNGSGKTTLIEALNFITTDTKPSGQYPAFIHNLEICGRPRVDGLVKLKFQSANGKQVTATKRLCLSRAPRTNKLTGKQEESTIVTEDVHGNKVSLSSKVADTKTEILNLFDVPSAILTNVIFCHQENSTWPLAEPKQVKEKFDAIFELSKYVKAVDKLRKLAKDENNELQVIYSDLKLLQSHFFDKKTKEREIAELKLRLQEYSNVLEMYNTKKTNAQEMLVQIREEKRLYQVMSVDIMRNEATLTSMRDKLTMFNVPDYPGSQLELQAEIERLERSPDFQNIAQRRAEIEVQMKKAAAERQKALQEREALDGRKIEMTAVIKQSEQCTEEIRRKVQEVCERFDFQIDGPFVQQIQAFLQKQNNELDKLKKSLGDEKGLLETTKDQAVSKAQQAKFELKAKSEHLEKTGEALDALKRKRQMISNGQEELESLQRRLAQLERQRDAFPRADAGAIDQLKQRRNGAQQKLLTTKAEHDNLLHLEEFEKALARATAKQGDEQRRFAELVRRHEADFGVFWPDDTPVFPVGDSVKELAADLKEQADELNATGQALEKTVQQERAAEHSRNNERSRLRQQISGLEEEISQLANGTVYSEVSAVLSTARERLKKARKQLGPLEAKSVLYDTWIEESEAKHGCPLCDRKFPSKAGYKDFVDKLSKLSISLPGESEQLARQVAELEQEETLLVNADAKGQNIEPLAAALRELEAQAEAGNRRLAEAERKLTELNKRRGSVTNRLDAINRLLLDVNMMDSLHGSLEAGKAEIDRLNRQLGGQSGARSLSDVKAEKVELEDEVNRLLLEEDRLQNEYNKVNQLAEEINRLQSRRLELGEGAANLAHFDVQIREKEQEGTQLREESAALRARIPDLRMAEADAIQAVKDFERQARSKEQQLEQRIREIEGCHQDYVRLKERLSLFGHVDHTQLARLNEEGEVLERRVNEVVRREEELRAKLDNPDQLNVQRQRLSQQLGLMDLRKVIAELELKQRDEKWNGESIEVLERKEEKARNIIDTATQKIGEETGKGREIEGNIAKLSVELKSDKYRQIEQRLKKKLVEKVVAEYTKEDLTDYAQRMEGALMKFHQEKMEAVNEILENLWRRVYRGTDIDTIQIRSEMSGTGSRSKYDYRVMMVLDNKLELEMRDRCSAGQKMLASILIRIALSDVFGGQCSILALDEPTTNLDVQKIDDMAEMLVDLINARSVDGGDRAARAFQLIIITHDERFVSTLRRHARPEIIYHVAKDVNGKSRLTQERMNA